MICKKHLLPATSCLINKNSVPKRRKICAKNFTKNKPMKKYNIHNNNVIQHTFIQYVQMMRKVESLWLWWFNWEMREGWRDVIVWCVRMFWASSEQRLYVVWCLCCVLGVKWGTYYVHTYMREPCWPKSTELIRSISDRVPCFAESRGL